MEKDNNGSNVLSSFFRTNTLTGLMDNFSAGGSTNQTKNVELEREETLLKIDRMRSLAPSSITEDLANIATVLCNNAANNSHVSMRKSQSESNERTSCASHPADDISPAQSTLLRVLSNTSATSNSPMKTKKPAPFGSYSKEPSLSDGMDTWKDHDQLEIEELQNKIIKLERQVKLDSDALIKSKITCMNHELLCEENQQLQRTVDNLTKKQQDLTSNYNMELTLAKREVKSLHRRILELTEELSVTKEHVAETSLQTSTQLEDIQSTHQQVQTLELQVSIYENQIKLLNDEKNELHQQIVSLEEELHASHAVKSQLEEEIASLQQTVASKEKQEAKLYSALQMKSLSEMQSKQQEQSQVQVQSQKMMDDVKLSLRKKEKELQEVKNRLEDLQHEHKKAQEELLTHQERQEDKEHLMKMAKMKIDGLTEQIDNLELDKRDLAMAKESIENDLALERMNATILKDDLLDLSKDKVKMMSSITSLQKQMYDMQEQLENERVQKEALIVQLQQFGHSGVVSSAVSNTLSALSNRQKSMMTGLFGAGTGVGAPSGGHSHPVTPATTVSSGMVKSTSSANLNRASSPMPPQVLAINDEADDEEAAHDNGEAHYSTEVDSLPNHNSSSSSSVGHSHAYTVEDAGRASPMPPQREAPVNIVPAATPSPTPASYYNATEASSSTGSSKAGGLFKFSLPSQINLGKIQLPTALTAMGMSSGGTSSESAANSPVPPSAPNALAHATSFSNLNTAGNTSSYGKRAGSSDVNSPPTTSSTILSLARKQSDTNMRPNHASAQENGYESYEDNDSDDNGEVDIGKFRPLDETADYSYD